jgi:hypothetical protein
MKFLAYFSAHFTKQLDDFWATLYFNLSGNEQVSSSDNSPDLYLGGAPFSLE